MASPKTITSSVAFQDTQGTVLANGFISFDLNSPSEIASGGGQVVPSRVFVNLTSAGLIPNGTTIWANDQLNPTNTLYSVRIFNSNGLLVSGPLLWSVSGISPIDLSQEIPVSSSILSFPSPSFLLNAQGNSSAIVGTGSAVVFYTYTIPANAVSNLKAIRLRAGWTHSTGSASVSYSVTLNGQSVNVPSSSVGGTHVYENVILNTGSTTGTFAPVFITNNAVNTVGSNTLTGLNWAAPQVLQITFSVAATDQITPFIWTVELIQ